MKTLSTKGLWAMALLAASAGFAVAQDAAPTPATPTATAEQDEDPMICRNERVTGSTIPKRVCMTKSQRDAARQQAQTDMAARSRRVSSYSE